MTNPGRRFSAGALLAGIVFALAFVPASRTNAGPATQEKRARPRLAVFVVFDQMRGDYPIRWQALFGKGGFQRLQAEGTWFQNCHYPYANTLTAPGHASLGTGASPYRHGIVANDWYDRASGKTVSSVESEHYRRVPPLPRTTAKQPPGAAPTRLLLPTLGDALKDATGGKAKVIGLSIKDRGAIMLSGRKADLCSWFDANTGSFVTSTYYRDKLPTWLEQYNHEKPGDVWLGLSWAHLDPQLDYVKHSGPDDVKAEWTGYGQGRTFPHPMSAGLKKPGKRYYQAVLNSPYGNELLLGLVKKAIDGAGLGKNDCPDLLCVSFSSNDLVGHTYGPDSQEVLDITLRSDLIIKELLDYLDAKVGKGQYVLALSADHGVCPLPEVARSKGLDAGRIGPVSFVLGAEQLLNKTFGSEEGAASWVEAVEYPWIYLNQKVLKQRKLEQSKVEEALARWLSRQAGIQAAYTRTSILKGDFKNDPVGRAVRRSFYPDRSGDIQIVMKPYYLLSALGMGTTHGSPHFYDTHVPLMIYGAGIQAKIRQDPVTPQAGAVILAHALGIKPPAGAEAPLPAGVVR